METIKKIKDCTCQEIDCSFCPFKYRWEIKMGEVDYDKRLADICIWLVKNRNLQEAFEDERVQKLLTEKEKIKMKQKLNKAIIFEV